MEATFDAYKALMKEDLKVYKKLIQDIKKHTKDATGVIEVFKGVLKGLNVRDSLVKVGKYSVEMALEVNASINNMKRTMGESTQSFLKWTQDNARLFNLSRSEAIKYGEAYSKIFSHFTKDGDQLVDYTTKIVQTSAVVADATGKSMEDVVKSITQGVLGSTDALKNLGINIDTTMIQSSNAFAQFANGQSWEQLDTNTQQAIRAMAILEQASLQYGESIKQGPAVGLSYFNTLLKDAALDIGNALLPAVQIINQELMGFYENFLVPVGSWVLGEGLKQLVDIIGKTLSNIDFSKISGALKDLWDALTPFAIKIGEGLLWFLDNILSPLTSWTMTDVVPSFLKGISGIIDILSSVLDGFKPYGKWLFDNLLTPLATWTGGVVKTVLENIGSALDSIGNWCKENDPIISAITTTIGLFFGAWKVTELLSFISQSGGVLSILKQMKDAFALATVEKIKDKIETAILNGMYAAETVAKWASVAATGAMTAATWLFNAAVAVLTSPITLVVAAITALVAVGYLLVTNWDTISAVASQVWQAICDFIGGICNSIGEFFAGLWNGIVEIFTNVGTWFGEMFQQAWDNIVLIFGGIGQWFIDRWNDIVAVFSVVGSWFASIFQEAWNGIVLIFTGLGQWFGARWNDIVNVFSVVGGWFSGIFQGAWNDITTIFSIAGSWFGGIWNGITGVFAGVSSFFSGIFQGAWNTITGIFGAIPSWFSNVFSTAWTGVKNIFSTGGQIFSGITQGIANTFKIVVNAIIDGINKVVAVPFNVINKALDGIRGVDLFGVKPFWGLPRIGVPQIPRIGVSVQQVPQLAKGGIVNSATLALVGEAGKEAVMPLENNTGWITQLADKLNDRMPNTTQSKPITVILNLPNGKEFTRWTIDSINDLQSSSPYPLLNI